LDFNLDDVPRVADFLLTLAEEGEGGLHIQMGSRTRGHLAGFPAWDHADRDLRHFTHDDIPLGDEEEPYLDADDDWRIVILRRGNDVYILEGDSPHGPLTRRYRIPHEQYFSAWDALIRQYHRAVPLDEVLGDDEEASADA
jgi:hypothetical protein